MALAATSFICSCTTTIVPPEALSAPVPVFVIDYGRHSSLLLPGPTETSLIEYAYGDWRWFALDRSRSYHVFPTLFWPTPGTLGRRVLCVEPDADDIRRAVPCENVLAVVVASSDAMNLSARLHETFERNIDSLHFQPLHDAHFVKSERPFHLFNNCNHAVAAWLRELGCQIHGSAVFADFALDGTFRPPAGEN